MPKLFIKPSTNKFHWRLIIAPFTTPITALGVVVLLCLTSFTASANRADFTKEIKVVADKESIDLKNNLVIFTGNVAVIQGSMTIKAQKLTVSKTIDQNKTEVFTATGQPATYNQTLEDGKPIAASANSIRYEMANRTLVLRGDARLQQNDSVVKGETMRYNLELQQLFAEGEGSETRVTAIFTPTVVDKPKAQPKVESKDPAKDAQPAGDNNR